MFSTVGQLKVLAAGRKNIFADFASVSSPSETDIRRFAENAVGAFSDAELLIARLETELETYTKSMPGFIDDFLSPEGIMTKKRSVDRKIQDNKNEVSGKRSLIAGLRSENTGLAEKIDQYLIPL